MQTGFMALYLVYPGKERKHTLKKTKFHTNTSEHCGRSELAAIKTYSLLLEHNGEKQATTKPEGKAFSCFTWHQNEA